MAAPPPAAVPGHPRPLPPTTNQVARATPPLRLNTDFSTKHVGSSGPVSGPMYALPPSYELPRSATAAAASRARPGGLAAMRQTARTDSTSSSVSDSPTKRDVTSRPLYSRRGSNDTGYSGRRRSDHSLPQPDMRSRNNSPIVGARSLASGREGTREYARALEATAPNVADLQRFAQHCRDFYFSPDPAPESATYISSTLAGLPPSHRATYTRLQSALRSLAHLHHLRLRIASFHALISSTISSASLSLASRSDLSGKVACLERKDRLKEFITMWCTPSSGGVEPFFRGLWSALRLQSRGSPSRGGGGGKRVIWEIDDAVFLQAGGTEFMHEAVLVLKGVLGFDDQQLTSPPKLRRVRTLPRSFTHPKVRRPTIAFSPAGRSASPLKMHMSPSLGSLGQAAAAAVGPELNQGPTPNTSSRPVENSRTRAISDPFIDPRTGVSPQKTQRTPSGRGPAPPPPSSRRAGTANEEHIVVDPLRSATADSEAMESLLHDGKASGPYAARVPGQGPVGLPIRGQLIRSESSTTNIASEYRLSEDRPLLSANYSTDSASGLPVTLSRTRTAGSFPDIETATAIAEDDEEADDDDEEPSEEDLAMEEAELNKPRFRLWTFPAHIPDQEAEALMGLFPRFITHSRSTAQLRFPLLRPGRGRARAHAHAQDQANQKDLERNSDGGGGTEGWDPIMVDGREVALVPKEEMENEEGVVRSGTGRIWAGTQPRCRTYQGGRWYRFIKWWRRLFGLV